MIWTFTRGARQTQCEIRRDTDGIDYEFVVTSEDGSARVEQFDDPAALIDRSVQYFKELFEQGWRPRPDPS
jgi:hypothetical protein